MSTPGAVPMSRAAVSVTEAVARRRSRPAAWWGMLMLIASEGTILVAMIVSYFYLRFTTTVEWPPRGIPEPAWIGPVICAVVLAISSVPMELASFAANAGRVARARVYLVIALALQLGYLAYQLPQYRDQLQRLPISTNAYTSIYYTLLGADHVHVAIGVVLVLWLLWKLRTGFTLYRVNAALAIAWYWHFVNVATLLVTATLLSPHA